MSTHPTCPNRPGSALIWSSDSSDEEEGSTGSSSWLSDDSGAEGELESFQSGSAGPDVTGEKASFSIPARGVCGNRLLELVKSKNPDVNKAREILADLGPEEIKKELSAKDGSTKDGRGNSVIHYACMKTLVNWVKLLIQYNADLNLRGAGGKHPIHFAVRDKALNVAQAQDKADLVNLLVSNNVPVNVKDGQNQTPLQLACKFEGQEIVIRALLEHRNIKVDQPVKFGRASTTVLNQSCQNANFETALLLLEYGADPLKVNAAKNTPLYIILKKRKIKYALRFLKACEKERHDMLKILSARNMYEKMVLHEAIKTGNKGLVKRCIMWVRQECQKFADFSPDSYLMDFKSSSNSNIMHTACKQGHLQMVQMLHDLCPRLLDVLNSKGLTPLHYACRGNHAEVVEELCLMLKSSEKELKIDMEDNQLELAPSLLKFTAMKGASDSLVVLLKYVKAQSTLIELVKWLSVEKNLPLVLQEVLNRFDDSGTGGEAVQIEKIVLLCAAKGQTESLQEFVAWHKGTVQMKDEKGNTVMHLIAHGGHLDTAKAFLKNQGVELCKQNMFGQTPLHLTIKQGHKLTTKLLLKADKYSAGIQDKKDMTPLMYACKVGNLPIVKMLLEQEATKFFACDHKGRNCLDHAIRNGHEMVAVTLLSHKNWRTLMAHSTGKGGAKTTPMRNLITNMPGVCRFVLDKCITRLTDEDIEDKKSVKIKIDYELLEDWFSEWMKDESLSDQEDTYINEYLLSSFNQQFVSDFQPQDMSESETSNFHADGRLKGDARIYVKDSAYRSQNHPLRLMIQNDESKELLNHPVVRLMFRYKHKSTRFQYWIGLLLQIALVTFVTGHSLVIPPPFYVQTDPEGGSNNYTWLADGQTKWKQNLDPIALYLFGDVGTWIIFGLAVIYFFDFAYRLGIHKHSIFNSFRGLFSIIREVALQVSIILFIWPWLCDLHYSSGVKFKKDWQWQLGAFAVFLTWFNFILFLQTAPFFGLYIFMFLEVFSTLMSFVFVFGIFIMAFALVFCILLQNQEPFHTLGNAIGTISSGEISYSNVFHSLNYLYQPDASEDFTNMVFYPISTHIIFVLFIIFMPILITNLLTGLAVYDIEIIQTKAQMHKRTLEAKEILDDQDNSLHALRSLLCKTSWPILRYDVKSIRTDISLMHKLYYKAIGYNETHDQLVAFLEELEKKGSVQFSKTTEMKIEDVAEHINDIRNELNMLSENASDAKIQQLDAMTSTQKLKKQIQNLQDRFDKGHRTP